MNKKTIYSKFFKRFLDLILSIFLLLFLSPILIVTSVLIRIKLGSPIIFKQIRPGLRNEYFKVYKFRTMLNLKDSKGKLLSDEDRLTKFGKFLRSTSLDELPELFNILRGQMSFVGPRPQLVSDVLFMSKEQNKRHDVMPGLTGLAQINGRNQIDWEKKIEFDLDYIKRITFLGDVKILYKTFCKVLKRDGITTEGMATSIDFGDYLLQKEKITFEEYVKIQDMANNIIKEMI